MPPTKRTPQRSPLSSAPQGRRGYLTTGRAADPAPGAAAAAAAPAPLPASELPAGLSGPHDGALLFLHDAFGYSGPADKNKLQRVGPWSGSWSCSNAVAGVLAVCWCAGRSGT